MRSADLALWMLTTLTQAFVVYLFVAQKLSRDFFFLSLYFLLAVTFRITRFVLWPSGIPTFHRQMDAPGILQSLTAVE